jgi:hypothetical protein
MTIVVHIEPHLRHDPCPATCQAVLGESGCFGEALLLVRLPSFCGPGRVSVCVVRRSGTEFRCLARLNTRTQTRRAVTRDGNAAGLGHG